MSRTHSRAEHALAPWCWGRRCGPRYRVGGVQASLDDLAALVARHRLRASGDARRRLGAADQRALVGAARQHDARRREVAERLQHGLVHRAAGAAGASGQHQVQADVAGLSEQRDQRLQRVAGRGGHQVVVVDQHVDLGAGPPGPGPQLLGSHVRAGEAAAQVVGQPGDLAGRLVLRGEVPGQVLLGDLAEQRPPEVDREDLRLLRGVQALDLGGHPPEQRGLAGAAVAERVQVRLLGDVHADGGQVGLVDAEQQPAAVGPGVAADRLERDLVGEQPQLGARGALPGGVHRLDQVLHTRTERGGRRVGVDAGERGQHVVLRHREAAARPVLRDVDGDLAVDLGVHRVAEPQLEPGAEHVLHLGAEVHPARGGGDQVHAERQAAAGERLDARLQLVELGADRGPAVDQQEHVAVAVVGGALRAAGAVGLDRVDALLPEVPLPVVDDRLDLGHRAAHDVGLGAGRDARHVRERGQRRERAAAEVEHVELHLERGVRQGERGDHRAQHSALAGPRGADHGHVARRAAQLHGEVLPPLLQRPVDRAERDGEGAGGAPAGGHETEARVHDEVGHELVERAGHDQRRQPHLVRGRALALHPLHGDVERRARLLGVGRDDLGRRGQRLDAAEHRCRGERLQPGQPRPGRGAAVRAAAAGLRRARHVRGAELDHRRRVRLEVAHARDGRQRVRVGDAQHGAGLGGGERAQADPVGQVRLEPAEPALLQALRGQQQVHLQRTAEAADGDEQVDELRLGGQQLGELVADDQQRGQRLEVGPAALARLLVVGDVGEVARGAQQLLAADHLALQRVLHAVDERELLAEVGDDRGHVRHVRHAGEGRTTLEVDEDEVQVLGGVRHRQREHERAEHLGLAGAGGADDQTVRAHALLGRLLDVERDGLALRGHADRDAQPVARQARAPGHVQVEVADVTDAQQVDQLGGDLVVGPLRPGLDVQGQQAAGGRLGVGHRHLVAVDPDGGVAQPQHVDGGAHRVLARDGTADVQPQRGRLVELAPAVGQLQHGHAEHAVGGEDRVADRHLAAVDHDQHVRQRGLGRVAEPGAVRQVLGQQRLDVGQRRADHPGRADGVAGAGGVGVRQPLDPVPLGQGGVAREHRDLQVLRGVERGELRDDGARQRAGLCRGAGHLDPRDRPDVERQRHALLHPVRHQEPVRGRRGDRVELRERRGLRRLEVQAERLRADADPRGEEVVVLRPALPDAGALLGDRGQRARVRRGPLGGATLGARGLAHGRPQVRQVREVLPAGADDGRLVLRSLPPAVDADEAQRRQQEHPRRDVAARTGLVHRHEHDGAHRAQHRDRVGEHPADAVRRLDLGRRLQDDLPAGDGGRLEARPLLRRDRHRRRSVPPAGRGTPRPPTDLGHEPTCREAVGSAGVRPDGRQVAGDAVMPGRRTGGSGPRACPTA